MGGYLFGREVHDVTDERPVERERKDANGFAAAVSFAPADPVSGDELETQQCRRGLTGSSGTSDEDVARVVVPDDH